MKRIKRKPSQPVIVHKIRMELQQSLKELTIKKILFIMFGAMILTFGVYNIHQQSDVTEGGVIGLVVLFHHLLGISPAIIAPTLDILCYLLALRYLGISFLVMSGISSLFVSMFYGIWELNPPVIPSLIDNPLLAAVVGALFVGIGVGLIVTQGGSSGGDDALVIIISKRTKLRISQCYIVTDTIVLLLSLLYITPIRIMFSLLSATISSIVIGQVVRIHEKTEKRKM